VPSDLGRGQRRRTWPRWLGPILAGVAAAIGAFAAVAAGLYLPHGDPPSAVQYAWAALASSAAGALTFLQVRKTATDASARSDHRSHGHGLPNRDLQLPAEHGNHQPTASPQALAQLPPDIADFTGRTAVLEQLQGLLERAAAGASRAGASMVIVVAIAGKPGVGKTALALHAAHRLRSRFPDGQLYVNLRGAEAEQLDPAGVLGDLLHALGVADAAIPDGLEARTRLYRSRLADRQVLVLLDNAAAEAQIRPLLPGSARCAVLVTSRARLAGLDAAHLVDLDVLPAEPAMELLAKIAGGARVAAEPEAAQRIVERCGYLPLAIRIAGARLASRPQWRLARLAERLGDEQRRLSELAAGDREVRATFALSYHSQADDLRRAFRLLGLVGGFDFAAWVAAPLMSIDLPQADELVERLADAQLVESMGEDATGQLRYRFHDLLGLFAREQLEAEEPPLLQRAALKRLIGSYLELARQASASLPHPSTLRLPDDQQDNQVDTPASGDSDLDDHRADRAAGHAVGLIATLIATGTLRDPDAWFVVERAALVAAVEWAHRGGWWALTYNLAASIAEFLRPLRGPPYLDDLQRTHELALDAARRANDPRAQATTLCNLNLAYRAQGRWDDAQGSLEQALLIFRDLNDRHAEATVLRRLGMVHRFQGQWATAITYLTQALAVVEEVGDRRGQASTLRELGIVYHWQGRLPDAVACLEQSLQGLREVGDRSQEVDTLGSLGRAYADQHRFDDALTCLQLALGMARDAGSEWATAHTLLHLGRAYRLQRHFDDALRCFDQCLPSFRAILDRSCQAITRRERGDVYLAQERFDDARACYQQALSAFQAAGTPRYEHALALQGLGGALAALGDRASAIVTWRDALAVFTAVGAPEAEDVQAQLVKISSLDLST
jgi:tetratricopeptide (TPR) repeat protein